METLGNRDLTEKIIAAVIRVHKALGLGFLESIYEEALAVEFEAEGIGFERQKALPVLYRGKKIGEHRLDYLVESTVIIELKATAALEKIHFSIVRSYLKAAGLEDALLFNLASMPLTIKRVGLEQSEKLPSLAGVSFH